MDSKIVKITSTASVVGLFYLGSYPLNGWFSFTMLRHQILQLPSMFVLGISLAFVFSTLKIKSVSTGISILIGIMFSVIFWMLPHSIDVTIVYPRINTLMHLNMIVSGFFLVLVFRHMIFEVKLAFVLMLSSMLLATGASLKVFSIVLCSSFTLEQQHETGVLFMILGLVLFLTSLVFLFSQLAKAEKIP